MKTFSILNTTPVFPTEVYDNLPPFLKQLTDQFVDPREKDIVLTSILVILSGCFSSVVGQYKDWIFPNLYCFIVAPPASGKGVMKYPQLLGTQIQRRLINANKEAKDKYDKEYHAWRRRSKKRDASPEDSPPKKPKYPVLFIPGNTSSTSIYKRLDESDGTGIICETEADTLSVAIKQDWGNFSDLLRKASHHEPLSLSRSGDDIYLYIEKPRLSVLLTGTPDQVPKLISSTQDGLCSRFLFYCYSRDIEWIDPTPCKDCPDLQLFFEKYGETVAMVERQLADRKYPFKLTDEQFRQLSDNFTNKLASIELFEGPDAASAVIRLGIIGFRIAMILTVIRQMENLKETTELVCSTEDFGITMALTDVYFEHAMALYHLMPKYSKHDLHPKMRQFYSLLPTEKLARKEADEKGKSIGICERTVGSYLEKFVETGIMTKPEYGYYLKTEGT